MVKKPAESVTQNSSDSVTDENKTEGKIENPDVNTEGKPDVVAHETYLRTLGEAKKFKSKAKELEDELNSYRSKEREKEEKDAIARGEFDKVTSTLKAELEDERKKRLELEKERTDNRKLGAFLGKLGGTVDREYWALIDTDQIAVDPDTNEVDDLSVKRLVDSFKAKHSRLIDGVNGPRMHDETPDRKKAISVEDWRKLPLKERKERMPDVVRSLTKT